jgi:hypothetical protein
LACDAIRVINRDFADLPNVVTDEEGRIHICASTKWKALPNLHGVFVSIISHETLHVLLRKTHAGASDDLDNIGSLSVISKSLNDIPKCRNYPHGIIGVML